MPRFVDDRNDAYATGRVYYRFPVIKFLRDGMHVSFGEALGPELNCRKVGRLQDSDRRLLIVDVRLVWNVKASRLEHRMTDVENSKIVLNDRA